jgi:hypothetical protein
MVATERLGRATGRVEASGQKFALGEAQMFRMGASSLHHNRSVLGDFLRRMKANNSAQPPGLRQRHTSWPSFSTRSSRSKSSTTKASGQPGTHNDRSASKTNLSGNWLGLCPDNDKSGGQVLWTGVRRAFLTDFTDRIVDDLLDLALGNVGHWRREFHR